MRAPKVKASDEMALTARPSASTATQLVVSPRRSRPAPRRRPARARIRGGPAPSSASASRSRQASLSERTALVPVPERPAGGLRQQVHRLRTRRRQPRQQPVEEPGLLQQHPARATAAASGGRSTSPYGALIASSAGTSPPSTHSSPRERRAAGRAAARPRARRPPRGRAPRAAGPAADAVGQLGLDDSRSPTAGTSPPGSSHRARSASRASAVGVLGDVAAVLRRCTARRRARPRPPGAQSSASVAGAAQPVQRGQRADRPGAATASGPVSGTAVSPRSR